MKRIEYIAPEMEVVKLNVTAALLAGSGEELEGSGDSEGL